MAAYLKCEEAALEKGHLPFRQQNYEERMPMNNQYYYPEQHHKHQQWANEIEFIHSQ